MWRFDRERMRLFQYNKSFQIWFQWDHIQSGRTRATTLLFHRSHCMSEHINDQYEITSVLRMNNTAKIIPTGIIHTEETHDSNTEDWAIQYVTLPDNGGAQFAKQVQAHKGQTAGDGSCKEGRATEGLNITFVAYQREQTVGRGRYASSSVSHSCFGISFLMHLPLEA